MSLQYVIKKLSKKMSSGMRETGDRETERETSLLVSPVNLKARRVVTTGRTSGRSGGIFGSLETPNQDQYDCGSCKPHTIRMLASPAENRARNNTE